MPSRSRRPEQASSGSGSSSQASSASAVQPARRNPTGADPNTITDSDGNATQHHEPRMRDSQGGDHTHVSEARGETNKQVRILAHTDNPIRTESPGEDELIQVVHEGPECIEAGPDVHVVTEQWGTVEDPHHKDRIVPENIYIDDNPTVTDIMQGGIGDCWFFAALTTATSSDAAHVKDMIDISGTTVTGHFHRYDGTNWVPVDVSTDWGLLYETDGEGNITDLHGAGFNASSEAEYHEWGAKIHGQSTLIIGRYDYCEAALWAPLIEKCLALYAQTYGQFGGFDSASANAGASGYEVIDGGFEDYAYLIMYGADAVTTFDNETMSFAPGSDLVATNLPAIRNLLRLAGEGVPDDQSFQLTVSTDDDTAVERLDDVVEQVLGAPEARRYRSMNSHLQGLRTRIDTWRNAAANDKAAKLDIVARYAAHMCKPGEWPLLHSADAPRQYRELNEHLNIVTHVDTDASNGQRFVYTGHAYAVLQATLRDADGGELALTMGDLATRANEIDPDTSTVQLRNPHGTNTPNEHGSAEESTTGIFDLTLDQYIRSFSSERGARVRT